MLPANVLPTQIQHTLTIQQQTKTKQSEITLNDKTQSGGFDS